MNTLPNAKFVTGDVLKRAVDNIAAEADGHFALKKTPVSFTLPITGWVLDNNETSVWKYYYDLSAAGITAADIVQVVFTRTSLATAQECGMCINNESFAGIVRLRAEKVPTAAISGEYWIE